MAKDKDYIKMINSSRWLRLRRDVLSAHPLCECCQSEGYITPASEVHHIRPVESGIVRDEKRRLMFDINNLMSLCHKCHVKIHTEMGRSGKDITRQRVKGMVEAFSGKFFGE